MNVMDWKNSETRDESTIRMCLAEKVMYHVLDEESLATIWLKLESRYMLKSLTSKLLLKKKLYGLTMAEGSALDQHLILFNQIISDRN